MVWLAERDVDLVVSAVVVVPVVFGAHLVIDGKVQGGGICWHVDFERKDIVLLRALLVGCLDVVHRLPVVERVSNDHRLVVIQVANGHFANDEIIVLQSNCILVHSYNLVLPINDVRQTGWPVGAFDCLSGGLLVLVGRAAAAAAAVAVAVAVVIVVCPEDVLLADGKRCLRLSEQTNILEICGMKAH